MCTSGKAWPTTARMGRRAGAAMISCVDKEEDVGGGDATLTLSPVPTTTFRSTMSPTMGSVSIGSEARAAIVNGALNNN